MMNPIFIIGGCFIFLFMIVLLNTLRFRSPGEPVLSRDPLKVNEAEAVTRLSQSIQFPTLSSQNPKSFDQKTFREFSAFLKKAFPSVHQCMESEVVNDYSILFKWAGSDESLKPAVFIAHFDVVPVEPGTEQDWTHDAFSGKIADGFIWGRGAIDMKSVLISQLEAAELLIKDGFTPKRTIYFAYGHDEEVGGANGAKKIAELFKKREIEVAFTLDEGLMILDEELSWINKKLAVIALAEKGYVTLRLTATYNGGHSSVPPAKTTLGILSRAIYRLERSQKKASLSGVAGLMFKTITPDLPWKRKILFANLWLFKRLIVKQLEKDAVTNAMIRTTLVPTIISGGVKENILPSKAQALVNFRLLPGDSIMDALTYAKKIVDDPNIDIVKHSDVEIEASPVSDTSSAGYRAIEKTVQQVFPGTRVAPGLEMGGTDSKHYLDVTENSYRFSPIIFGKSDMERIHGTDERIGVKAYLQMIQFYIQFMKNVSDG